MARNDGRTPARDVFGKPGVSYPQNSTAHPLVVEQRAANQVEAKKTMLAAHPNASKYPGAKLVHQESSKGDNTDTNILEAYETLPGPWVPSTRIDPDGVPVTVRTRRNVAADITSAESLAGGVWTKTTKQGEDANKADEVEETRAIPGNWMYSTRIDDDGVAVQVAKRLQAHASVVTLETLAIGVWTKTTEQEVSDLISWEIVETRDIPGNAMTDGKLDDDDDTISIVRTMKQSSIITVGETVSGSNVIQTTKQAISDLVAWEIVRTRTLTGTAITSKAKEGAAGGKLVTQTVQKLPSSKLGDATTDFRTLTYEDKAIGQNQIERHLEVLPSNQTFPIISGSHLDRQTGIIIDWDKQIVEAGTTTDGVGTGGDTGYFVEHEGVLGDYTKEIKMRSKIRTASVPTDTTYLTSRLHSFPDYIDVSDVELIATTTDIAYLIPAIIQGYRGPCEAREKVKYLTKDQYAAYTAPTITKFWPNGHRFAVVNSSGQIATVVFPTCIHDAKTFSPAIGTVNLTATTPNTLPFGEWIYVDVDRKQLDLGYWRVTEIEVKCPALA